MNVMVVKACFAICIVSLAAFLVVLGYKDWKLGKARREYELQIELQAGRMEDMSRYWQEISRLLEDIRKDLENDQITDALVTRCSSYTAEFITGVEVVDALIGYKRQICREQGIAFEADIKGLPAARLSDTEYVGLFGNLLDNAIEAAAKTDCPQVKAESQVCGAQWVLKIVNSKPEAAKPLAANLMSTKGSGHGLGTKIVSKIVKRHGGAIEYQDMGGTFQAMVVFEVENAK